MADADIEPIWQGDEEPEDAQSVVVTDDEGECEPSD